MSVLLEKLPPNVMAERGVLGGILLDNGHYHEAAAALRVDDFLLESHRRIFRRMAELAEAGTAIDIITLTEALGREREVEKVGGVAYLSSLTDGLPRRPNLEHYLLIVRDHARRRQLARVGEFIAGEAAEGEQATDEIVAAAQAQLLDLGDSRGGPGPMGVLEIVREAYGTIDAMCESGQRVTGVATWFEQLDEMTAGLQPKDLVILAARPSMGKTAFACDVATNVATRGGVALVFSLEMAKEALTGRMLCSLARVDSHNFRRGFVGKEEHRRIVGAFEKLAASPLEIDDTPALGVAEMRVRARALKMEHGGRLDLVVIDYLQLVTPPLASRRAHANRNDEVAAISRALKAMAKELGCPVLCLSQLSRAPEMRSGDHRPVLSDLRDSGAIEQDADLVCFLYREEVYKPHDESLHGLAELIVAKQRNGPTGVVKLAFLKPYTRFENKAEDPPGGER